MCCVVTSTFMISSIVDIADIFTTIAALFVKKKLENMYGKDFSIKFLKNTQNPPPSLSKAQYPHHRVPVELLKTCIFTF